MNEVWVGVDVSKEWLDVAVRPGDEAWSEQNNQAGIKALTRRLKKLAPERIVLEATGGYEYELALQLGKAGLPVAVVNPRQVRDFAKAVGRLAKTDPIDAKILSHFAEAVKPSTRLVKDPKLDVLDQLVTRHRQLVEMIVAERNRRMSLRGEAQNDIDVTVRFLKGRLKQVDERLKTLIDKDPEWNRRAALLNSVPGVGPVPHQQCDCRTAGAWNDQQKTDRIAGRSGSVQQRQRKVQRKASYLGWPRSPACTLVYGSHRGSPVQCNDTRRLPTLASSRQASQSGPRGLYAQAPRPTERHG